MERVSVYGLRICYEPVPLLGGRPGLQSGTGLIWLLPQGEEEVSFSRGQMKLEEAGEGQDPLG